MTATKLKKSKSNRLARKRLAMEKFRSFGLECLERRTVMASDLANSIDEIGSCFAAQFDESQATSNQSAPSIERTFEERSSAYVSLVQGDIIELQVPEGTLWDNTALGTYELRVAYAENYFSMATNLDARGSLAAMEQSGNRDLLDFSDMNRSDSIQSPSMDSLANAGALWLSQPNIPPAADSDAMFLLASLTASQDFDGSVRVLDYADQNSQTESMVGGFDRLPNEVRIEPRVTVPTALRDPGATVVKTIVVNRVSNMLNVSEASETRHEVADDSTHTLESASPTVRSSELPHSNRNRPIVTLKTIDISQSRRGETSRPWIRSTSIPNPSHSRDFGFESKAEMLAPAPSTPSAKADATEKTDTRTSHQVFGTKLQPVDFLLSRSKLDLDQTIALIEQRDGATDQAISEYMDESGGNPLQNLRELGFLAAVSLQSSTSDSILTNPRNGGLEVSWDDSSNLYLRGIQAGVASNKETWKNMLRSASESTAGQVLLASLSTAAVQQRDINAFGTKSAWEFVTKPVRTSPV